VLFHVKQSSLHHDAQASWSLRMLPRASWFTPTLFLAEAFDHDDGGRHRKQAGTASLNHRKRTTRSGHRCAVARDFLVRTLSLERNESSTRSKQGSTPRPESSKRRDRPRDNYIGTRELLLDGRLFRATPNHTCGQRKSIDDFGQPRHPTSHWFQKSDVKIGSNDRERHAGQPGAGSEVHHTGAFGDRLTDDGRVEEVPVPETVHLTGTDQAPFNADGGEQFRELHRRRQAVTKNCYRCFT
jgi:hypothetical protein